MQSKISFRSSSISFTPSSGAGFPGVSEVGCYYALVALPVYQFLMYRWAYRMILWTRCLGRVSNLDLPLTPTHLDLDGTVRIYLRRLIALMLIAFAGSLMVFAPKS